MTDMSFFTSLSGRALIQIEGKDRYTFLQGLITNDIENLKPGLLVYACLLSPQGKFLYDFFISEAHDTIFLECEGGDRAQDLYNRLTMYRLRSDVQISWEDNAPVYVA